MDAYFSKKVLAEDGAASFADIKTDEATAALRNYHHKVRDFMLKAVPFFITKDSDYQICVNACIFSKPEGISRSEFVFRYPTRGRVSEVEITVRPLMGRVNVVVIGTCDKEVLNKHVDVHDDNEVLEEIWRVVVDELTR